MVRIVRPGKEIAPATAEAVSLLSINWRIQMRQNDVDFQNRELPTNILALLLVTTRRVTPDEAQRLSRWVQEQTAIVPLNQRDRLAATPKMAA